MLDHAACHAAVEAKDRRYDGVFFIAVTSTGIYCRCVCSARTPKPQNRRFYPSAAAAEEAGFRPCLLCRPELAPGYSRLEATDRIATQALRAIEAGSLDEGTVDDLAAKVGVSERHLRRAIVSAYGASPIALAQTHRLLTAKRLLRDTDLPITEVAFAAGFQSLRRFNALFQARYGMAPQRIRAQRRPAAEGQAAITLRLAARGSFDAPGALAFLADRIVPAVERIDEGAYTRSLYFEGVQSPVPIRLSFSEQGVTVETSPDPVSVVRPMLARIARAFDLDTDIAAVDAHLARSPLLAADVVSDPGVRLVCGLDPFEIAVRAVIGQQISVAAARTVVGRLCALAGEPLGQSESATPDEPQNGLTRAFPQPHAVAALTLEALMALGLTGRRAQTLLALAARVADEPALLSPLSPEAHHAALLEIPGIGPWTASYIALRALGDADAFPAGDLVLQQATGLNAKHLEEAAQAWRPYRGYAVLRLWRRAAQLKRRAE